MTNLPTLHQITARIWHLPGREPFMLAVDLAAFYGVEPKRIVEAVRRNPDRFPEDFCSPLTVSETQQLKSQNATSMMANRAFPIAFFEGGALMLSSVLRSERAAQISVLIVRAFIALKNHSVQFVKDTYAKHVETWIARSPVLSKTRRFVEMGWTFEQIWRALGRSQPTVVTAIRELQAFKAIDRLPEGMPAVQMELFGHA